MKTNNGGDKTKAEAVSWSETTLFETVKALEHVLVFVKWDPRSVIGDCNDGLTIDVSIFNSDAPCWATMLDRVIHEIRNRIEYEISITRNMRRRISNHREARPLFFGSRVIQFDNFARDCREVDGPKRGLLSFCLNLRKSGD